MRIEIQHTKTYGVSKREVHSDKCLHLKQEKSQINNLKKLEIEEQAKPKVSKRNNNNQRK